MTRNSTRLTCHIDATPDRVYRTILDPRAVAQWMVPDGMTSEIHAFEAHEGGYFRISLSYDEPTATGKTTANVDTYHGRFVELVPDARVVQAMEFETSDAAMGGEMTVTFSISAVDGGTRVLAVHDQVPAGISAAGNELGWRMALDKLKQLVEADAGSPARVRA